MSDIVIRVENLSKRYRIGLKEAMHDTLAGALADFVRRPVKNLRRLRRLTRFQGDGYDPEDIIWALKDMSFEVRRGEVVGIIGRNGAGKTTLLKVLSRITHPTSGRVEIRGRVSSLLEVGTGFHPELTGRDNIYLNGTILGMKKAEIDRKFDDIVEFSGVEKFIDTPVKRYSSGMRVRLAFSVAAHLEPEILLVDEVLAVGDAAFQKKCLGKMGDVAKEGRTVLFVSHNMGAIQKLCDRSILLSDGYLVLDSDTEQVVKEYLTTGREVVTNESLYDLPRPCAGIGESVRFSKCYPVDLEGKRKSVFLFGEPVSIYLEAIAKTELHDISVVIGIDSFREDRITTPRSEDSNILFSAFPSQPLRVIVTFDNLVLVPGGYWLTIALLSGGRTLDHLIQIVRFEILKAASTGLVLPSTGGYVCTVPKWERAYQDL